ncbi:ATP-dependent helicase, partial [Saprospiraceae bacterium]|nr:ATP-dependent helicase [Saprospiraceae bacterium]
MEDNNQAFDNAFDMLNDSQRKAVVNFEGPLMVIAGPGTGKTQLLAIRIGYILRNTDAQAHNIIALTYTDAGAIAMRQRLLKFIGPDAYRVNIFTFHAFCSSVIRDNVEYFGGYRNLQAISELEMDEVLRGIIDSFDYNHLLKRLSGNIYFDRTRLKNLFDTIKKEAWTKEEIKEAVAEELKEFKEDENNYYKKKTKFFNKGDFKINAYKKVEKTYVELLAGVDEFDQYDKLLGEMERFDYNDMILWVINAFQKNESLLLDYQERYQYFLVDEYQDTNGSQNDLLFLLSSYWEKPNLFVVGDDDQSIYRFQGANMGNLLDFKDKFDPEIIVLENNYRSTQTILESSKKVIENNKERLVNSEKLTKNLIRSRQDNQVEVDVQINRYFNTVHEEKDIVDRIEKLYAEGYDLSKVAVIYRKHKNVENIIKYLNGKNIPLQIRREIDVLKSHEINRIQHILQYFQKESTKLNSAEDILFKILHYEYFGLKAKDIAKIAIYCSRRTDDVEDDRKWKTVLSNLDTLKSIELENPDKIYALALKFEQLALDIVNCTPGVFFELLFTELGVLDTIMTSADSTWRLQLLNSFFNFIKDETSKDYTLTVKDILERIDVMLEANIAINLVKIAYAKGGVNFTTIHSSKGLEYDIVFFIKGDKQNWKPRGRSGSFKFPNALSPKSEEGTHEDDRRLFYVAMTRAKNELFITYSDANEEGKKMEACSYIIEIEDEVDNHNFIALKDEDINAFKYELLRFQKGEIQILDQGLIEKELEHFSLSATGLNKYLKCPLSYYFENILRVPGARNKYNGFGSAMHYALELFFMKMKEDPEMKLLSKEFLFKFYEDGLQKYRSHFTKREHDDFVVYGKENLGLYYDTYGKEWESAKDFFLELKIKDVAHKDVPINGMIDRVMVYD